YALIQWYPDVLRYLLFPHIHQEQWPYVVSLSSFFEKPILSAETQTRLTNPNNYMYYEIFQDPLTRKLNILNEKLRQYLLYPYHILNISKMDFVSQLPVLPQKRHRMAVQ